MVDTARNFGGSIPEYYDSIMGPAQFEPFPSARLYATGQLRGTPRGALLEKRGASLDDVIARVAAELAPVGGAEPFNYTAQALLVEARAV